MPGYPIIFDDHTWEEVSPGMRQKLFVTGSHRMRLLELTNIFVETDWCLKEHTGYVVQGSVRVELPNNTWDLTAGNGFYLSGGEKSKHKASVVEGKTALLVLFESV